VSRSLAQSAGHELVVRPYTSDFHEVRGTLSALKTETLPIELDLPYGVCVVGAVPVVTPQGARVGAFVLPSVEDVDVSIATDDSRYEFGALQNEGENRAKNSLFSLAALKTDAALLRLVLGKATGTSRLVFRFAWRDPATVTAAAYLPCVCSLTLLLARLDSGSQNALWRSRSYNRASRFPSGNPAPQGTRSRLSLCSSPQAPTRTATPYAPTWTPSLTTDTVTAWERSSRTLAPRAAPAC